MQYSGAIRSFNTTGPVEPGEHYCISPLDRLELEEVLGLIRGEKYFVLHAPRQTGKTSTLLALRDLLNSGSVGDFRCVYASLEAGRNGDVERAMRSVLGEIGVRAEDTLGDELVERSWPETLATAGPDRALRAVLGRWAAAAPSPLVLFLDEVDTLTGNALLSLLTGCGKTNAAFDERCIPSERSPRGSLFVAFRSK